MFWEALLAACIGVCPVGVDDEPVSIRHSVSVVVLLSKGSLENPSEWQNIGFLGDFEAERGAEGAHEKSDQNHYDLSFRASLCQFYAISAVPEGHCSKIGQGFTQKALNRQVDRQEVGRQGRLPAQEICEDSLNIGTEDCISGRIGCKLRGHCQSSQSSPPFHQVRRGSLSQSPILSISQPKMAEYKIIASLAVLTHWYSVAIWILKIRIAILQFALWTIFRFSRWHAWKQIVRYKRKVLSKRRIQRYKKEVPVQAGVLATGVLAAGFLALGIVAGLSVHLRHSLADKEKKNETLESG